MRAVIQRVKSASVDSEGVRVSSMGEGLLVLLGVGRSDTDADAKWISKKIPGMRIFEDPDGNMNLSLADTGGSITVVSQFTLYADCKKGNRPGFSEAAPSEEARRLYGEVVSELRKTLGEDRVGTGVFRTHMNVRLDNDGPVTIILESPAKPA